MNLVLQVCLLALAVVVESHLFRADYNYTYGLNGWIKFHRIPAIWHEAELRCHLEGAVLASPENEEMLDLMQNYILYDCGDDCKIHTGVHATFSNGDFFSVEGAPLSSMPVRWMKSEPNNLRNSEQCIAVTQDGTFADVDCNHVLPYMCFKKLIEKRFTECETIDPEYVLNSETGNCYKFHRNTRTWSRAYMTCAAEGGHLAIPNSEEEVQFMIQLFDKTPPNNISQVHEGIMRNIMHIGFRDWGERSDWRTIEGQTLEQAGFSKFSSGEPNITTLGEFCGGMYRNGHLGDVWCHEVGPFMCEKTRSCVVHDTDDDL